MVYPRKPLPHADQVEHMKALVRKFRREVDRRYKEFFAATGRRSECALEVALLGRQIEAARETLKLAEACLKEAERQRALYFAPFGPGDKIFAEYTDYLRNAKAEHLLVVDVLPDKRWVFAYQVVQLTKAGLAHKRQMPYPLLPLPGRKFRLSDLPESEEAKQESDYLRQCAKTSTEMAVIKGDLDLFKPRKRATGETYEYWRSDRPSV